MLRDETNDCNKLTDLMSQELTDDELRELLTRLGEIEFAWSPKTTLKDVVEATSADPVVIGRLLAEIRKEDWEERFGLRLSSVEDRIERVENELDSNRVKNLATSKSATRALSLNELFGLVLVIGLSLIIIILLIIKQAPSFPTK